MQDKSIDSEDPATPDVLWKTNKQTLMITLINHNFYYAILYIAKEGHWNHTTKKWENCIY